MVMANSNEYELVKKFVVEHLTETQNKIDQCQAQLVAQSLACPKTLSLDIVDDPLQDFVISHRKQLSDRMIYQLSKFKDDIQNMLSIRDLISQNLTVDQVLKSIMGLQYDM